MKNTMKKSFAGMLSLAVVVTTVFASSISVEAKQTATVNHPVGGLKLEITQVDDSAFGENYINIDENGTVVKLGADASGEWVATPVPGTQKTSSINQESEPIINAEPEVVPENNTGVVQAEEPVIDTVDEVAQDAISEIEEQVEQALEENKDAEVVEANTENEETVDVVETTEVSSTDSSVAEQESIAVPITEQAADENQIDTEDEVVVEESENGEFTYEPKTGSVNWDRYTNNVIYNNLNSNQKAFYKGLQKAAKAIANSSSNCGYYTAAVNYSGLSSKQAINTAYMFLFSNPQYYFLSNGIMYSSSSLSIGVYSSLRSGSSRAYATNSIIGIVENEVAAACSYGGVDRIKYVHDTICQNVTYVSNSYDQSVYSTFMMGRTVCAGYAEAFSMIMNAAGFQTICVTSTGHQWNQINLNNVWYVVDCTWDDTDSSYNDGVVYDYFMRSYASVNAADTSGNHKHESLWPKNVIPEATGDSYEKNGWCEFGGLMPAVPNTKYTIVYNGNKATSGSMNSKTLKYATQYALAKNKFKRTGYNFVGWNTAKNGSGAAFANQQVVFGLTTKNKGKVTLYAQWSPKQYKIKYSLGKGEIDNTMNPETYTYNKTLKLQKPVREGYKFVGWYADKACTQKVTKISKGTMGTYRVYAKWKKVKSSK